MRYSLKLCR